eukprot:6039596-Amphidinium_carterae.3
MYEKEVEGTNVTTRVQCSACCSAAAMNDWPSCHMTTSFLTTDKTCYNFYAKRKQFFNNNGTKPCITNNETDRN